MTLSTVILWALLIINSVIIIFHVFTERGIDYRLLKLRSRVSNNEDDIFGDKEAAVYGKGRGPEGAVQQAARRGGQGRQQGRDKRGHGAALQGQGGQGQHCELARQDKDLRQVQRQEA